MATDLDNLTDLMLACDFTYAELEAIASQFLGLTPDAAHDVMAAPTMQHKVADLVAWSDRQGQLDNLTAGVLGYGRGKRAVREWILSPDMGDLPSQYASLEKWLERVETRLVYVERELQRLAATMQLRQEGAALNWPIIIATIIIAFVIAGAATVLTVMR